MKKLALAAILLLPLQFSFGQGLAINVTNGVSKVSWPLTNYYSLLQSSTNLAASNSWNNVGSASPVAALFAGGGGSSLGYRNAGGKILLAVDSDPIAIESYKANSPGTKRRPTEMRGTSLILSGFLEGLR